MNLFRLLSIFLLFFSLFQSSAQIKVNVSTPLMPSINLNEKEREFKDQFKQLKKDILQAIEDRIETIEKQIKQLENIVPDSADFRLDSAAITDTSGYSLDSLYESLSNNDYIRQQMENDLDSINEIKGLIKWDSIREEYLVLRMQEFFQSKGYLPTPASSDNPVEGLKNSMQNNLPGMHLDPESFKSKEALAENAAKRLTRLKSKYVKVNDIRYPEKGVEKPKPYNNFTDRLIFGGQINVTISKKPNIDIKPNVGFMLSKRIRVLVDYSANYFMKPKITFLERDTAKSQKIGTLLDVDITKGFFVRGKVEKTLDFPAQNTKDFDYLLGVGKTLTLYKNVKAQLVLSHSFTPNENGKRWLLEYGIQQRGISNLFKKKGNE